jgi:hypothetical protein
MKQGTTDSRAKMKLYIYCVIGAILIGIVPIILLLCVIGVPLKGIIIVSLITILMASAIAVRVKVKIKRWETKEFYLVLLIEVILVLCIGIIGYFLHFELISGYIILAIIVIDRLLHVFFRMKLPTVNLKEDNEGKEIKIANSKGNIDKRIVIYHFSGALLFAIIPLALLLWLIRTSFNKGVFVLCIGTLLFLFVAVFRIKMGHNVTPAKHLYLVRFIEAMLVIIIFIIAYFLHAKIVAAWSLLSIVVVDCFLHVFLTKLHLNTKEERIVETKKEL